MITPGFFGFFNAHRSMVAAQNAMSTINHNISNANTEGYSRQRVELQAYDAYTVPTISSLTGGQIGQGPQVSGILRIRDQFLDTQLRHENSILGQNTQMRDILQQIEGILAEPSTGGVNGAIQNFFDAAQELSTHPESSAVRSDFLQQASDLVTVFQQQAYQLQSLRTNLVGDPASPGTIASSHLAINVGEVNNLLGSIAQINKQIVSIQSTGAAPNDLLDQRDLMLDKLSKLVDIKITAYENNQIDVAIGGETMIKGTQLRDTLEVVANPGPTPSPTDTPSLVRTVNGGVALNDGTGSEITSGTIKGILDIGGNDPNNFTVQGTLESMNTLLTEIVNQVNTLQNAGRDQDGNATPPNVFNLAAGTSLALFRYSVNPGMLNNPRLLATAIDDPAALSGTPVGFAGEGDGRNALAMAQLRDKTFAGLNNTGFVSYFNTMISELGIETRSYENRSVSQSSLLDTLETRRASISGVNVDEEMIDLLRFQRAFEATSKTINTFNEVYKTIINMV